MKRQAVVESLRADAERNRELVLVAARAAFAERGLDVAIEEIARRAGVGVATLYRRFPTRASLIAGAFETKLVVYAEAVEQAALEPDAWTGFCRYIERICEMQAEDLGFAHVSTMSFPVAPEFDAIRARAHAGFVELVRRAKASGDLRPEFVVEDFPLLLMANAGVLTVTGTFAPKASGRLVGYLLRAFATSKAARKTPLPPAPSPRDVFRSMQQVDPLRSRRGR